MKSLTELWMALAADAASICNTRFERDGQTVRARVKDEGLSFLTISLPNFATDFESSLRQGRVDSGLFYGFRRKGGLPVFLSGFLCQVFDAHDGVLLSEPSVLAVRSIRQLCLFFKKIELECTDVRKAKAIDKYKQCEDDLKVVLDNYSDLPIDRFKRMSGILFGDVFNVVNREVATFSLDPAHGPGATADRKVGNQKYDQSVWTDRLEEYFPFGEYVLSHWKHFSGNEPEYLSPEQETPVRVVLVPKTLKTPRVIAIEPTCMQYAQQGLMRSLVPLIEQNSVSGPFTHFTDQSLNQRAAQKASVDGSLATLDLSEASDRVLNQLVVDALSPYPDLLGAVQASRTTTAELPDGTLVPIVKFASMGSALCFPMEAIVFTTLVFMGIEDHIGHRLTRRGLRHYIGSVHVYGDDMIVPVESVPSVIGTLEAFGLRVNAGKSFSEGHFRESCGGDFFLGKPVNPVRLKQTPPVTRQDALNIENWVSTMNLLDEQGMENAALYMRRTIEEALQQRLTKVPRGSGAIGISTDSRLLQADRMNPKTQVPEVKALAFSPVARPMAVGDIWALRKTLTANWEDPMFATHLTHSGRSLSASIKRAWVPLAP